MRFAGERRAIAAAALGFFTTFLGLASFQLWGQPEFPMFAVLGLAYLVAFFGLVSGWFWARWYSLGLAFSGVALAILAAWQEKTINTPVFIIFAGHLAVGIGLLGDGAAAFFDARRDWRERWKMDQNAVNRLGKAVMRAGASLPYLIVAGLNPRAGMGLVALLLGLLGLAGLVRLRTWGLLVLAAAAGLSVAQVNAFSITQVGGQAALGAAILLAAAVVPFAGPIVRSLRPR